MNDERLDALIDAHLNGVMIGDERIELEERLLHSAADRARFWELAETHVLTHEVVQQRLSVGADKNVLKKSGIGFQPVNSSSQAGSLNSQAGSLHSQAGSLHSQAGSLCHDGDSTVISRSMLNFAAAAMLLIVGAVAWLMWPGAHETGLMLASADAMVKVEREGKVILLPVGASLRENDVIITEEAGIVVSYPEEETRLELAPATRLEVLNHRDGKQLRLLTGSLSAEVSPQPEGSPMRLFTPGAEAVVLGTRFTLNADPANRELAVQKGAVRVNRAESADSIVVSAEERVKLDAKVLELEALPGTVPPRWRDEHTLAFDFESELTWPVLRTGRVVMNPAGEGRCLAGELVELVRRKRELMVLATGLRPQCVMSANSVLRLRYWAASGVENIELFLYVFGIERAFKVELKPTEHERWANWTISLNELMSSNGTPPSDATVRSISIHTSPISEPLPFYIDDVVLEHVSPLPTPSR